MTPFFLSGFKRCAPGAWLLCAALLATSCVFAAAAHAGELIPPDMVAGKQSVAAAASLPPPRGPSINLSAGLIWRHIGEARFQTGSYSQHAILPRLFGRGFSRQPNGIAGSTGYANRTYDDGFVFIGAGTPATGLTSFWGYQNAGQVQGDFLTYHAGRGGRARMVDPFERSYHPGGWSEGPDTQLGPYIELSVDVPMNDLVTVGGQFSFSWFDFAAANSASTFYARQVSRDYSVAVLDRYRLNGVIPPLPPFSGSFAGPGPLIPNVPASRFFSRRQTDADLAEFFNRVDEALDVDVYTLSLGPEFKLHCPDYPVFISLALGLALNITDWEAAHHERLYVSENGGRARVLEEYRADNGGTEVLWGFYLMGTLGIEVMDAVTLEGFIRGDWAEDYAGTVGPSDFTIDIDGLSGGVMLGINF